MPTSDPGDLLIFNGVPGDGDVIVELAVGLHLLEEAFLDQGVDRLVGCSASNRSIAKLTSFARHSLHFLSG